VHGLVGPYPCNSGPLGANRVFSPSLIVRRRCAKHCVYINMCPATLVGAYRTQLGGHGSCSQRAWEGCLAWELMSLVSEVINCENPCSPSSVPSLMILSSLSLCLISVKSTTWRRSVMMPRAAKNSDIPRLVRQDTDINSGYQFTQTEPQRTIPRKRRHDICSWRRWDAERRWQNRDRPKRWDFFLIAFCCSRKKTPLCTPVPPAKKCRLPS